MQSVQWQFGITYLGLFGTAALLLYIHVSGLTPLPPHGMFAILISACCCGFILYYRRSKYVDTNPVGPSGDPRNGNPGVSLTARLLRRFGKVLNPSISVCASLTIVLAGMGFLFAGLPEIERSAGAALQTGTHVTGAGWIALIILPLFYPIADVTNWQRIAAAVKNSAPTQRLTDIARCLAPAFRSMRGRNALAVALDVGARRARCRRRNRTVHWPWIAPGSGRAVGLGAKRRNGCCFTAVLYACLRWRWRQWLRSYRRPFAQ